MPSGRSQPVRRSDTPRGDRRALIDAAARVAANAYAPYSRLNIGAALRTSKGSLHTGCNIENASFGLTCCAERSAIFAAVAAVGDGMKISEIAVVSPRANGGYRAIAPCGACRQVIQEFSDTGSRVTYFGGSRFVSVLATKLLPAPFAKRAVPRSGKS